MNTNDTKSNFGKWGWSMILYCALSYYLAAALSTDTLNFFPSIFTELRGWDASAVDTMNTMAGVGGWFGVIAAFAFSILAAKMGSRVISVIGNILAGIICILFATTQNFTFFLILIVLMVFVSGSVQLSVVPNNLMNIWFPKKKGLALGWASMGLPLCTATIVLVMNAFVNAQGPKGISTFYIAFGIVCFVFAAVSWFWCKNTPEEVGCTPDNQPIDLAAANRLRVEQEEAAKKLTSAVLLKNRNTWLIGLGMGFMWMTTIGLVSNFVTRLCQTGVEPGFAVQMLTVAAICGIVGSYIWGWLDQRFSTRTASVLYGIWYLIALLIMIFMNGTTPMVILAAFFVGVGIGGIGNLIPSMIGTCFGRFGFIQANKIISPINTAVRCSALIIIGIIGTANLPTAYGVFLAFDLIGILMVLFVKPTQE